MKTLRLCLVAGALNAGTAFAQKASTGTFTLPPRVRPATSHAAQPSNPAPQSALSQKRRALIMQQRQDRIQFEQQYKTAMQSLETSAKGQTPAQQTSARAQAQQEWRTKRKTLLDTQRQARAALNSQGH